MKKLFTFLFAVVACVGTMLASSTQVDGIWYDFNNTTSTAVVTYQGDTYSNYSNEYTGSVVIPASVTFSGKTYTVTGIGVSAFRACSGLTSVTIPNSVTSIGNEAFYNCTGLTSITCEAMNPPTLGTSVFSLVNISIPLYVPAASINAYMSAKQWKNFYNILPIGSQGIEEIVENNSQDGKFMHEGKVYILRGDKVYTLQGQEVK